ncbi:diheme cytochrome C [Stenomitos frigidus]|uniref:Diheme cytochrome C n=1 Tax=Stenomitos frigidus ULC18 TaxID=2107698 RepID=A0A2T1DVT8_9CYAN|nr:diheme cytochrome C [Stenomitos frigidus]PSB24589.1 diheme cytochrome C [Stenomitos frigidus ULC18]
MPHPARQRSRYPLLRLTRDRWQTLRRGRSAIVLLLLLLTWSLCLGWGLAQAKEPRASQPIAQPLPAPTTVQPTTAPPVTIGTVDVVPKSLKLGQDLYLENCASCHIGVPPQVMPTETWRQLIQDSQHYGAQIQPLVPPNLQIVWQYIRTFSRPQGADEDIPYRVYQARYFKALHPKVKLPTRLGLSSCVSCHAGAGKYDFRSLTAEWQNAP